MTLRELIPCGFTHQVPVLKAGTTTVALKLNFNSQIGTVGPLVSKRVWFLNHPPLHLWWSELAIHPSPPPCMEHLVPSSWWRCLGGCGTFYFLGHAPLLEKVRHCRVDLDSLQPLLIGCSHILLPVWIERFWQLSAPDTMPRLPWLTL